MSDDGKSDISAEALEIQFPLEFIVQGTPVSSGRRSRTKAKEEWKERVKAAGSLAAGPDRWPSEGRIAVTLFYFPAAKMKGDIDNVVKLIIDALKKSIYVDDSQIERVLVQKFEPGSAYKFSAPSKALDAAINGEKPLLYVRVSTDPLEELV